MCKREKKKKKKAWVLPLPPRSTQSSLLTRERTTVFAYKKKPLIPATPSIKKMTLYVLASIGFVGNPLSFLFLHSDSLSPFTLP